MSEETEINEPFGQNIRHEFLLREGSVFINHGSYGAVPRRVFNKQLSLLQELESHPDDWFRRKCDVYWQEAITSAAEFFNTHPDDTFLVQNVTKGVNTVLKSYPLKTGDAILISNLAFSSITKTAHATTNTRKGTETLCIEITFPIYSEDDIVEQYNQYLQEHPNIKIAVVEHITGPSAVLMPVKRITEVCHKHDVTVVIDGAHGPGQLSLNIPEYGADFYIGNFHKWMFNPRGCAVFWKNPKVNVDWLTTLVTAGHHGKGLQSEFRFEGTKDDCPYFCVKEAIKYFIDIGGMDKVSSYNISLVEKAGDYLEKQWRTESLQIPPSMEAPFMKVVRCPELKDYPKTEDGRKKLADELYYKHDVQTCIVIIQGDIYFRLSAQIYNVFEDYVKLANIIKQYMNVKQYTFL